MYQLEEIAFRYLPRTLIEHWEKNPDIRPVWYQWLDGSLMHCDVTGFTAMSENLGEVGKEGAELMAGVLNQFFERMLAIAVSWGGIQIKFGGDAMLLYFPDENHAQRAAACGLEMQSVMREFNHVKVKNDYHNLRMRIGIHSGRFFVCSVGQVGTKIGQGEGLLHYYIVGKDVNKAADTEPMAEPGQVVVSTETYNHLSTGDCKMLSTEHENIWLVKKIAAKKHRLKYFDDTNLPHHILQRYLMRPIAEGLSSGKSEHRRTTIIFIYVTGIADLIEKKGEQIALSQINEYTNLIIATAEKYGGYFAASDASEHGDKLIVLFGAPVMQDKQESSAMYFALEVIEKMNSKKLNLKHQIGINTGYVFCGEIGSVARREYTVIGDSVNLSARLMAAANENEILVSDFTVSNCGNEFILEQLEPIMVKGKKKPIPISRLIGLNKQKVNNAETSETVFVGRDKELHTLLEMCDDVVKGGAKQYLLFGDAGIGKTRLAKELINKLKIKGWLYAFSSCKPYNQKSAYSAVSELLYFLIGLDYKNTNEENKTTLIDCFNEHCFDIVVFLPLIADLLNITMETNPIVRSLDNKMKREKREIAIIKLINSLSLKYPVCIFIDNLQWLDSSSRDVVELLVSYKEDKKILIGYAARNTDDVSYYFDNLDERIEVDNLNDNDSIKLVSYLSPELEESIVNSYVVKTKGNPMFLHELANSSNDMGDVIPDTIYDVIMTKLDKLDSESKHLLQTSSVIGRNFDANLLTKIM